jgi:hypothetical protein
VSASVRIRIQVYDTEFDFEQDHPISDMIQSNGHGSDKARRILANLVEQATAALDLMDAQRGRTS